MTLEELNIPRAPIYDPRDLLSKVLQAIRAKEKTLGARLEFVGTDETDLYIVLQFKCATEPNFWPDDPEATFWGEEKDEDTSADSKSSN